MPAPVHPPEKIKRVGVGAYIALNGFFAGLALFVALLIFWARGGIEAVIRDRLSDIVTLAVLRPEVDDVRARSLAARVEKETPGVKASAMGSAEARELMAIQEPWMKNLPDIEIPVLPAIIEMRHPDLIMLPSGLEKFHDELSRMPETDYLIFNEQGHEVFRAFVFSARAYASLIGVALLAAISAGLVMFHSVWARGKPGHGAFMAVFLAIAETVIAAAAGWVIFQCVRFIARPFPIPVDPPRPAVVGAMIAVLFVVIFALEILTGFKRRACVAPK